MKKLFLIFIISGIVGAWWINSSRSLSAQPKVQPKVALKTNVSRPSPEAILANDFAKITANLNPKNIENDEWAKINDYSLAPQYIINKNNVRGFFTVSKNNLPDLYSCLKKDFCGMETRGEQDSYFDDERTPAHILIKRNLTFIKESLAVDPSLAKEIDWDLMQELAASNSEMLSIESLEIMREYNPALNKTDRLIELTKDSKGNVKAEVLVKLASKATAADKLLIANEVKEVFAASDANTALSVLGNVKKMAFNSTQTPGLLKNLCKFKEEENLKHNWPMVKYEANKIYADFEKSCN
jgi:hypothetical protein